MDRKLSNVSRQHQPLGDNRRINSIPPWVSVIDAPTQSATLLTPPTSALPAQHQYLPAPQNDKPRGRKWDHCRDAEPAMLDQPLADSSARWIPYMRSGPQPRASDIAGSRLMSQDWMDANFPGWTAAETDHDILIEKPSLWRRRGFIAGFKRKLLKNPFVPLVFRLIVAIFSLAAMGLGARLWHQTDNTSAANPDTGCNQRASTYMALILDCIAIPYIIYVTRDEYTSAPLGLRSATAKTSLLLFDLYFIVFYASNLTLAFAALTDTQWACYASQHNTCPKTRRLCHSQSGLVAVLFVALIAWLTTFSISVLRVVKRLRPDG